MSRDTSDASAIFVDAYNEDLARFGCAARVAMANSSWHEGSLELLDAEGGHLGYVPRSVEPIETAAFMAILHKQLARRTG